MLYSLVKQTLMQKEDFVQVVGLSNLLLLLYSNGVNPTYAILPKNRFKFEEWRFTLKVRIKPITLFQVLNLMIDIQEVTKAFKKMKSDESKRLNFKESQKNKTENIHKNENEVVDKHHSNVSKMRMKFSLLCLKEQGGGPKKRNNRNIISKIIEDQNKTLAKLNGQLQQEVFIYLAQNCKGFKELGNFEKTFKIPAKLDLILGYEQASVRKQFYFLEIYA